MTEKFRSGCVCRLVPYDKKHAQKFSEWYYDFDYRFFFRDFSEVLEPRHFEIIGDEMARGGNSLLIIEELATGDPIGIMTYRLEKPSAKIYKFGIMLDQNFQRKTYAIEAIILLGDHLFMKKGAHKLVVEFSAEDEQIFRITAKGGFTHDGTFKEELFIDGRYYDEARFSITRQVYLDVYAPYLESLGELPTPS